MTAFLLGAGLRAEATGARSYRARLAGMTGVEIRFLRSGEIPGALRRAESHLGVTGDDLIAESGGYGDHVRRVRHFDFGHARLALAVPVGWIDVVTMADLEDVVTNLPGPLRVATKYARLAAAFLARHGIGSFQIIASQGATEGAVAAGVADVIVDIYSSGRTLAANRLKPLQDGLILSSSASLIASRRAEWTDEHIALGQDLLARIDARVLAMTYAIVHHDLPAAPDADVMERCCLTVIGPREFRCPVEHAALAARTLTQLGASAVRIARAEQIFAGRQSDLASIVRA